MPIPLPRLDDRRYQDLVEDLLRRIPAHTPEWTNPRVGDPGRTLIELFAWLADTILYRANLVPERQRLAFLSLLGMPLRPAQPAKTIIALALDDKAKKAVQLAPLVKVDGPASFETLSEVTVFPCAGECYHKRKLTATEKRDMESLLGGLRDLYSLDGETTPYVTTRLYAERAEDFNPSQQSIDGTLWIALLAPKDLPVESAAAELAGKILNIGVSPVAAVLKSREQAGPLPPIPFEVAITHVVNRKTRYLPLDVLSDSSQGWRKQGVMRLALPGTDKISAPTNNVRDDLEAGVGENPPRIDDPERKDRVIAWLRMRPQQQSSQLGFAWVCVHAVEVDQMQTTKNIVIGTSNGAANQVMALPATSVDALTFRLDVEEQGYGWRPWTRVDDLGFGDRQSQVFSLDSEAGRVQFGDGMRGRVPPAGCRARVSFMRSGGGRAGNVPPDSLKEVKATDIAGNAVADKISVAQYIAARDGEDAETLGQAEMRLPAFLRHTNRAVTETDIRQLAAETPGQRVGRVELLPMFVPQQRRPDVPGVMTVMVLPAKGGFMNPNPRADRPFLSAVDSYLRARKPLTMELYVIGCEYMPVGLSVGVTVRDGFGIDDTLNKVKDALRIQLWPLAPGGPNGAGWPLRRKVKPLELEVAVARVPGVETVTGVRLFGEKEKHWTRLSEMSFEIWRLPELLAITVSADGRLVDVNEDGTIADTGLTLPNPFQRGKTFAVPVVPKVC